MLRTVYGTHGPIGGRQLPKDGRNTYHPAQLKLGRAALMKPATAPSALKVQAALGPAFQVLEFEGSTRTSQDAAAAIGCTVAEIAKSLIFKSASGRPVLVIASGVNR